MTNTVTDGQIEEAILVWGKTLSAGSNPSDFSSLYTANGTHTDHCHYYRQTGTAELEILQKVWTNSIQNCSMSIDRIDILKDSPEGNRRAHIWYTGSGDFLNDLTKTPATGEFVKYLGSVDFLFDKDGKIISGDEWMSNIFWKQPSLTYRVLFDNTGKA